MLHDLQQSYGGLFEKALIEEINQVSTFSEARQNQHSVRARASNN